MSEKRGNSNETISHQRNNDCVNNIAENKIKLIERDEFLDYFQSISNELAQQAVNAQEPFLAYLMLMATNEAITMRNKIAMEWCDSAA